MENLKKVPKYIKELNKEKEETSEVKDISEIKTPDTSHIKDDGYNLSVIVDYDGKVDPFYLSEKDPEYEYRFLNSKDSNLSLKTGNLLLQKGGWQLVPEEHCLKIGIKREFISPDHLYRVGDTVLARIPKELFQKKEEYKKKQASEKMNTITQLSEKGDNSLAGIGHSNMKGLQTKKQLGLD